ncbi:hypothetical protein RHRU231_450042 [Rhodococcus ruber]|uniref:Uncharacterized protein n=1 Tax=Rhodococcus ruber TaxID=1830 RepID=A0A098BKX3_9NOCA|nr:hypothetical protein RHRU231_450042 [Rhodococcus ruber]
MWGVIAGCDPNDNPTAKSAERAPEGNAPRDAVERWTGGSQRKVRTYTQKSQMSSDGTKRSARPRAPRTHVRACVPIE